MLGSVRSSGVVHSASPSHHRRLLSAPSSSRPAASRRTSSSAPAATASAREAEQQRKVGPLAPRIGSAGRPARRRARAPAARAAARGAGAAAARRRRLARRRFRRDRRAGPAALRAAAPRSQRRGRRSSCRRVDAQVLAPAAEARPMAVVAADAALVDEPRVGGEQRPRGRLLHRSQRAVAPGQDRVRGVDGHGGERPRSGAAHGSDRMARRPGRSRCRSAADEDRRAERHAAVQQLDVGDVHADAAVRRAGADRVVLPGAVDADAARDAHPARLQRVRRAAAADRRARRARRPRGCSGPTRPGRSACSGSRSGRWASGSRAGRRRPCRS